MLATRVTELGEQIVAASSRCEELEAKLESADESLRLRQEELATLEGQAQELSRNYIALRDRHTEGELALTTLAARLEDEKAGTMDLFRRTSMLHNTIHGLGLRRENLSTQKDRLAVRANEVSEKLGGLLTERAELETSLGDIQGVLHDTQTRLDETRAAAQTLHHSEQDLLHRLAAAREQRSAIQAPPRRWARCSSVSKAWALAPSACWRPAPPASCPRCWA